MTLPTQQRIIAVNLLLEKSKRNFEQAAYNSKLNYWDLVANRLYYSVFHAVNALLLSDGIQTGTHKGTSAMFGKHYVLTGEFDRSDGILYSRLQTMREKADYQNIFSLSEEQGKEILACARLLNDKIYKTINIRLSQLID